MSNITELVHQIKSAAQEEIMCREASDTSDAWQDLASPENILLLIDIALQVLEQQESTTDTYRQIENDDWIEWRGGECPVAEAVKVDVRFRNGEIDEGLSAGGWVWLCSPESSYERDIIAYRLVKS